MIFRQEGFREGILCLDPGQKEIFMAAPPAPPNDFPDIFAAPGKIRGLADEMKNSHSYPMTSLRIISSTA